MQVFLYFQTATIPRYFDGDLSIGFDEGVHRGVSDSTSREGLGVRSHNCGLNT